MLNIVPLRQTVHLIQLLGCAFGSSASSTQRVHHLTTNIARRATIQTTV